MGNKFEWKCIRGFAMQYRKVPEFRIRYIQPALNHHRRQHHHRCWNKYNKNASPDAMRLGAVDAICSLLEPREYQHGCHTYEDIAGITERNPIHKVAWMHLMRQEMERVEQPDLNVVTLDNIPNFGISAESHDIICDRLEETKRMLSSDHGIRI